MDMFAILQAALADDNISRNQAETALEHIQKTNPSQYFLLLSEELRNEQRPDRVRQLAGTQMKVSLDAQDEVLKRQRRAAWQGIDADTRNRIKDNVAGTIGASQPLARMAAAQVVAKIGAIEIQPGLNTWEDLLQGLIGTAARGDLPDGPRSAALHALGYLLEELDEYDESPLMQPEVDSALTAICGCMASGAVPVQRAAVDAMFNALPFVAENFEDKDRVSERNAIMMAICNATQVEDAEVKRMSFECISRVAELYYDQLGDYMKVLAELTATAARSKNEHVATAALDFWANIAEEEADRGRNDESNKKYTLTALRPLVEMVFDIMSAAVKDDFDDEYGAAQAAQAVLQQASLAVGPAIVDAVMPFINANFANPEWQKRDAAVMSFALILEDPEAQDAQLKKLRNEIILPALPHLMSKLEGPTRDPSQVVRESTAFALSQVFSHHVAVVDLNTQFAAFVGQLCRALEDEPPIAKFVAIALNNLIQSNVDEVDSFENEQTNSTALTPIYYATINALMVRADKPDADENELRSDCYDCITTVIEAGSEADQPILLAFLDNCLQRMAASLSKQFADADEKEREGQLQESIMSMVNEIMLKVQERAKPAADNVAAIIVRILAEHGRASAEALMTLCTMCQTFEASDFKRYMPSIYPLLRDAMRNHSDYNTCKFAIIAMGDVARVLQKDFAPVAAEVVDILKGILVNQEIMRSVKPPALSGFADIALAIGTAIEPYLQTMLLIVSSAAKTPIPSSGDEDLVEYLLDVRKACMDAFTAFFQAFGTEDPPNGKPDAAYEAQRSANQQTAIRLLGPAALPQLSEVIAMWAREWHEAQKASQDADEEWAPDFSLLQKTVAAIGDAAKTLGKQAVASVFTQRNLIVQYLCQLDETLCKERQEEAGDEFDEDDPANQCMAQYAKKWLPA